MAELRDRAAAGRRTELIALVILVMVGFVGFSLWRAPSSLSACLEQAQEAHEECRQWALRARTTVSDHGYGITQGARITDTAREGQLQACSKEYALAKQGCEGRFRE